MGFISNEQIIELKSKITSDPSLLRKLYKSKKSVDFKISVDHNLVEGYEKDAGFTTFETLFSLDIGLGFNSKKDKTKWIAKFNSLRNNWAHEASKNNGLSKEEVATLKIMYSHCNKTSYNNVYSA